MQSNYKEKLKQISQGATNGSTEMMDQFLQIMSLPDEQFDQVYEPMKKGIEDAMKRTDVSADVLKALQSNPMSDIESEKAAVEDFIQSIQNDPDLSEKKKDLLTTMMRSVTDLTVDLAQNPRERIPVKIMRITETAQIPEYAHPADAGADIFADEGIAINPGQTVIVKTGIKAAIPAGYEVQIRPRSGLSSKTNLRIANAPGTIDSNYRGEWGVILTNIGSKTEVVKKGDKIAQAIIAPSPQIVWEEVTSLDVTDRNDGGYGSTDTAKN